MLKYTVYPPEERAFTFSSYGDMSSSSTPVASPSSSNSSSISAKLKDRAQQSKKKQQKYGISRLPSFSHAFFNSRRTGEASDNEDYSSSASENDDSDDEGEQSYYAASVDSHGGYNSPYCYLLQEPCALSDMLIRSARGMRGHIVVCLHNEFIPVFRFIYSLR